MSDGELVSVVVPVYNGARFLREALTSIGMQDYEPVEVIIVDDGSTDESHLIANSFLARHEGRLLRQENLGPSAARNAAIAVARGDLITFLDADDEMVADRVRFQVEHLDQHPTLDVVIGSEEIRLDRGIEPPPWLQLHEPGTAYPIMSMMARAPVFARVGLFDTTFPVAEDTDWLLRARASGVQYEFVERILLRRRIHGANLMYRSEDRRQALFRALQRLRAGRMSEPLVSVIVPFHNQERYLAEALESILAQNYESIELLLVDDGSTDGSGAIARCYSPPAQYVHRRNGGAAAARNTGLLATHGELVSFCDSDDRWQAEKLVLQLRSFAADPELDVSFTGVREFVSPELDPASLPARAPRQVAGGVCVSSMLARRHVFSDVGQFDEGLRLGEWADWYARLLESGCKVAIHPEILVHRRLHDRNNTLTRWQDRGEYARVFKKALDRRRATE